MSGFPIPTEETEFAKKIKEVSQITYTVDADTGLIKNLVRVVMVPPLEVADTVRFVDDFGSIVAKVDAIDDDCGTWINKDDTDDTPCGSDQNTVLFVYLTPAQPDAQKAEIAEVLRKLKALVKIA